MANRKFLSIGIILWSEWNVWNQEPISHCISNTLTHTHRTQNAKTKSTWIKRIFMFLNWKWIHAHRSTSTTIEQIIIIVGNHLNNKNRKTYACSFMAFVCQMHNAYMYVSISLFGVLFSVVVVVFDQFYVCY